LLEHIAGKIFHVGDTGAGHAMKLIHNMICHTIFLATGEGCRLAETLGIPLETAIAVINAGNARSFVSEQRFPNHVIPRTFDGRSHTANLAKDLAMAAALARQAGQPGPYSALAARLLGRAMEQGLGGVDFTRLYEHLPALMAADSDL
jgi:3-hydroxyisobutyrate dehydrogenase